MHYRDAKTFQGGLTQAEPNQALIGGCKASNLIVPNDDDSFSEHELESK